MSSPPQCVAFATKTASGSTVNPNMLAELKKKKTEATFFFKLIN